MKTFSRKALKQMAQDPVFDEPAELTPPEPLAETAGRNARRKHAFEVARHKAAVERQRVGIAARKNWLTRPLQRPLAPVHSGASCKQVACGTARYEANLAKWKQKMMARGYDVE